MIVVNLKADFRPVEKAFRNLHAKQLPFAKALALTTLAKGVQAEEQKAIGQTFESPTPFTVNAITIKSATKTRPVAVVYPKDIAAAYLAPYVVGGPRSLGRKRGMIVPRGSGVNQYGNLPRGALQRLKGKPGVFVGKVTFRKTGRTISGVWQRPVVGKRSGGGKGTKGATQGKIGGARTGLKLLIQFEDTTNVRKHLPFYERADAYLKRNARPAFEAAMRRALATAKR